MKTENYNNKVLIVLTLLLAIILLYNLRSIMLLGLGEVNYVYVTKL